ncbi:gamma-tubulin complex component 4 homolog [Drosophila guanche]|uniref:Gamma-tubulin complex component n=1 Tax=Drosophila guanche TaxID=7266 RepID=A0A3B0K7U9_DROGU|nr:gamma-tubulin complex component 4 homolog [Drosophila guanche]SPP81706.1 blast:Gamma-tubulin complex component 4 homolog [Drosophila guanche]
MIHDLLLSCLTQTKNGIGIQTFLYNNTIDHFIHPCERELFQEILNIINVLHEVVQFTLLLRLNEYERCKKSLNEDHSIEDHPHGFYLINFGKGVEAALEEYYDEITQLETFCSKNKPNSLAFVHDALQAKLPILLFLKKRIFEIQVKKLHGCTMLHSLHQHSEHGDFQLERITKIVMKPVKFSFFSSMAHWLIFGVIDDVFSEFFIKFSPQDDSSLNGSCSKSSVNNTRLNAGGNCEDYIWQYEINLSQLPGFLSTIVAEKVLFVGQTVLVFKMGRSFQRKNKNDHWENKRSDSSCDDIYNLWNGKESEYLEMVKDLNNDEEIDVFHIESVVNDIKKYVSMRLTEIALNEVDLERQMGLIKDFYLLGRGEFYLEFLSQLNRASDVYCDSSSKNYTRSFELAATVMGITDDLENFSLSVQKTIGESDEHCDFRIFENLHLKYIYEWPLNLLFSPKAIERYNQIFRFLLTIRKLQYDLQQVWTTQTLAAKSKSGHINMRMMNLLNQLMFFLNNMQYYIQVDVLESQFSILINAIRNKADFEEIQKKHTVFLANVLSQCFLISGSKDSQMDSSRTTYQPTNPIYGNILELFYICAKCSRINALANTSDEFLKELDNLEERFGVQIASLLQLLLNIKTSSCLGPLSQLLLRLDFNHWFSSAHNIS